MNRRHFFLSSLAAAAIPNFYHQSAVQSIPEPQWDDVSGFFGNAWEILPKAPAGEVTLVKYGRTGTQSLTDSEDMIGILHNNTESDQLILNLRSDDAPGSMGAAYPFFGIVPPGAYGFVKNSPRTTEISDEELTRVYVVYQEPYDDKRYQVPIHITSMDLYLDHFKVTVTNRLDDDPESESMNGMVAWFDDMGALVGGERIRHPQPILPGESGERAFETTFRPNESTYYLIGLTNE